MAKTGKTTKTETTKESKGLGDTVEKLLKATKVDKVAKFLLGDDCGCDTRKEILNKMFPYRDTKCLVEDEYLHLKNFFSVRRSKITAEQQKALLVIYNRVFNTNKKGSSCAPCVKSMVNELDRLYKEYK